MIAFRGRQGLPRGEEVAQLRDLFYVYIYIYIYILTYLLTVYAIPC